MGGAHEAKSILEQCKEFLDPVPGLEAGELKRSGQLAQVLADAGEQGDAMTPQLRGSQWTQPGQREPILSERREQQGPGRCFSRVRESCPMQSQRKFCVG
jgi:hypothetical protein